MNLVMKREMWGVKERTNSYTERDAAWNQTTIVPDSESHINPHFTSNTRFPLLLQHISTNKYRLISKWESRRRRPIPPPIQTFQHSTPILPIKFPCLIKQFVLVITQILKQLRSIWLSITKLVFPFLDSFLPFLVLRKGFWFFFCVFGEMVE